MIHKQDITTFDFPDNAIIWDVRDEKSFSQGHIKGAINKPFNLLDQKVLETIEKEQAIYLLCGGGSKAPRAAELLEKLDSSREYIVLMGGTRVAKEHGLPIIE